MRGCFQETPGKEVKAYFQIARRTGPIGTPSLVCMSKYCARCVQGREGRYAGLGAQPAHKGYLNGCTPVKSRPVATSGAGLRLASRWWKTSGDDAAVEQGQSGRNG